MQNLPVFALVLDTMIAQLCCVKYTTNGKLKIPLSASGEGDTGEEVKLKPTQIYLKPNTKY
jgi:hypothetical protein